MRNINAVFLKQVTDTLKNKTVLIQFLMFPVMSVIMENTIKLEDMPEHFFAKLFSVMFVGMAPLTCMSAIISEEKEKNTLRALIMSGVRPAQYLAGTGAYVFIMCMLGTAVFAFSGGWRGRELAAFIGIMSAGIILSELCGAVIGVFSRGQMAATSITVPVMMVFSFLPMLSMFNERIERIARVLYSQQLNRLINGLGANGTSGFHSVWSSAAVIAANFAIMLVLFVLAYRKRGLE